MPAIEAVRGVRRAPAWLHVEWRDFLAPAVAEENEVLITPSRPGEPRLSGGTIEAFAAISRGAEPAAALASMGSLCDATVAMAGGAVWLVRGGTSRVRLFVDRRRPGHIRLTDRILPGEGRLRPDFLTFAMAHAILSPFERRATSATVFKDIECLPPGSFGRLDVSGALKPIVLDHATAEFESASRQTTIEAVRAAIDQTVAQMLDAAGDRVPAFEISGGIDSCVVASRALACLRERQDERRPLAITIHYPYHEFRREAQYAGAVADALGLAGVSIAGERCLPFEGWGGVDQAPCGDEPALQQVGRAQHLAALSAGGPLPRILFHGFGGDTIFGFGPALQFIVREPPERPAWITRAAWRAFLSEWETLRAHFPDTVEGHRQQFFSGANIDDCWADIYLAPRFGSVRAGGFTDPRLLSAVDRLWQLGPANGKVRYKWILRDAFRDSLPDIVNNREHKIAYDGLYVRGFRRHRDSLHALIGRHRFLLDESGMSAARLKVAVDRLAMGNLDGDLLLSMLLCCLEWLDVTGTAAR